jgi:alkylation response protein AidB-like acyl-CoA dehydrogenase
MFIVKVHQPGLEVAQIKMVNGSNEFCQEFFDDVAIPAANVVGEVNDGWTIASRLLFREREAMGGGSPYTSGQSGGGSSHGGIRDDLVLLARSLGLAEDPRTRQLVAEARAGDRVSQQLTRRVALGMTSGQFEGPAGSLPRLFSATNSERHHDIALEIVGAGAVGGLPGDPAGAQGVAYLSRQGSSLGGGSNEMQRNIISERILKMPREYAADKDRPFDEVRHNPSPTRTT